MLFLTPAAASLVGVLVGLLVAWLKYRSDRNADRRARDEAEAKRSSDFDAIVNRRLEILVETQGSAYDAVVQRAGDLLERVDRLTKERDVLILEVKAQRTTIEKQANRISQLEQAVIRLGGRVEAVENGNGNGHA